MLYKLCIIIIFLGFLISEYLFFSVFSALCNSRNYPYLSHGRDPPTHSYISLNFLALQNPLPRRKFQSLLWGQYGYFLELHILGTFLIKQEFHWHLLYIQDGYSQLGTTHLIGDLPYQGSKLRPIRSPMRLTFSPWQLNMLFSRHFGDLNSA